MDDDNELTDEYTETNADPYADGTNNNELKTWIPRQLRRAIRLSTKYGWIQQN